MIIPVIIALDYLKTFDLISAFKDCLFYSPFLGMISFFRLWIINFKAPTFQEGDNPNSFIQSPLYRLLSYNYVYALNTYLLLLPDTLCYDWAMGSISPIKNFLDAKLLSIICLWIILLRMVQLRKRKLISTSMVLLVMPFLPASNILVHVGFGKFCKNVLQISMFTFTFFSCGRTNPVLQYVGLRVTICLLYWEIQKPCEECNAYLYDYDVWFKIDSSW